MATTTSLPSLAATQAPRPIPGPPTPPLVSTMSEVTEMADLLLGNGDFNVYSKTRETLLAEASKVLVGAGPLAMGTRGVAVDALALGLPGVAGVPAAAGMPFEPCAPSLLDMFCEAEEQVGAARAVAVAGGAGAGAMAEAGVGAGGAGGIQASSEALRPASVGPGHESMEVDPGLAGSSSSLSAVTDVVGQEAGLSELLQGFVADEASGCGYLINSSLGYYFDPARMLFGDMSTGLWYRYEQGQYVQVS